MERGSAEPGKPEPPARSGDQHDTWQLVDADVNEPIWSRRVPGAVLYAQPGDTLKITIPNGTQ
jgi:hypothetical protein